MDQEQVTVFDTVEIVEHCTVQILTDSKTGAVSIGWWREVEEN